MPFDGDDEYLMVDDVGCNEDDNTSQKLEKKEKIPILIKPLGLFHDILFWYEMINTTKIRKKLSLFH